MIRLVGSGQAGELLGMGHPVEIAAVHYGSAHLGGHAIHIFGGGMGHDVGAPFKGTAVDGGGEGVVHNEGDTVLVGYPREFLYVEDGTAGVGDGLAKQGLGIGTECLLNLFLTGFGGHEGAFDAELLQGHAKQVEGAAVNLIRGDNMVACLADVEQGIEIGGLTAGGEHATHTAFKGGYLGCYCVVGGILKAGVEIAFFFQVKQLGHLVRVVILKGGALDDGQLNGFSVLGLVSCMDAEGGPSQILFHVIKNFLQR